MHGAGGTDVFDVSILGRVEFRRHRGRHQRDVDVSEMRERVIRVLSEDEGRAVREGCRDFLHAAVESRREELRNADTGGGVETAFWLRVQGREASVVTNDT